MSSEQEEPQLPAPVGPYAHATTAGGLLFISGQVALDPATGELTGETAAEQAQQALVNLAAIAAANGCVLATDTVKCTVLLRDMADFAAVNAVYGEHFAAAHLPARVAYAVAGLPKDARVEIDAVLRAVPEAV